MATARQAPAGRRRRGGTLHRFTIDDVERMLAAGILSEKDRVVLIDGLLVNKMTKGDPHIATTKLTVKALEGVLPEGWHVSKEDPILVPGRSRRTDSLPEPDVIILRGTIRDYAARKPRPEDVALVVEVSDSTLSKDRKQLVRYARAGIPVAWLINLVARVVEVYSDPSGPGRDPRYRTSRTFGAGEAVPVVIAGAEVGRIAVRDLMP